MMTTVGNNTAEILLLDLTIEILLRLPAKSLLRLRCVSKTWCFIICSRKFGDDFLSLSLSRPRLLLAFSHREQNRLTFFSSPHQISSFSPSTSIVAAKNNTLTMPKVKSHGFIVQKNSVRGFVCCSIEDRRHAVCNPNTRQVIVLPEDYNPVYYKEVYMYLGYDPSNDQYKVLRLKMKTCSDSPVGHSVCTLGSRYSWRRIESSILYYRCNNNGVCIDGVVYYEASLEPRSNSMVVSSFDVASEQLRLIRTPENMVAAHLTNYLGKLSAHDFSNYYCSVLWVLDDVENQVWSKKTFVFSSFTHSLFLDLDLFFAGVTAAGEIVYVPWKNSYPFEIFLYHVEKKVERRVRVEGDIDAGATINAYASVSCCYLDNIIYL